MSPHLHLRHPAWNQLPTGAIRGTVFRGSDPLPHQTAVEEATRALREGRFTDTIRQWNGFFALVVHDGATTALAVDRTRSIPLFYATTPTGFLVGDLADWVRERTGNAPLDPRKRAEFLLTGLVLNEATLCPGVFQLQSGETLIARPDDREGWQLHRDRYRVFHPRGDTRADYEACLAEYDRVLLRCFERTLRFARGRHLLIPLSGGYDSRLVILMLTRLGATRLATYTYSHRTSETDRSRAVATALGVPWQVCNYSRQTWQDTARDPAFWTYIRQAGNLASVAVIQEWPALRQLVLSGSADAETVVVPGHTADVLAGNFFTQLGERRRASLDSRRRLTNTLFQLRASNWDHARFKNSDLRCVADSFEHSIVEPARPDDWLASFDSWTQTERLSKFIVNSVRAYEAHGCDWWLPFFDEEYLAFWESVPAAFRLGEQLHCDFTDRLYRSITRQDPPARHATDKYGTPKRPSVATRARACSAHLLGSLARNPLLAPLRRRRRARLAHEEYHHDPMGWSAIVPEEEYVRTLLDGAVSINSLVASKYLALVDASPATP